MTVAIAPQLGGKPLIPYLLHKSNETVSRTSVNGADDATPSNLLAVTLPAGLLVGSTSIFVYGLINCTGDANKAYNIKINGVSVGSISVSTTNVHQLAQFIHANNNASGQITAGNPQTAFHGNTSGALQTANADATQPVEITITAQWSGATIGETIELRSAMVWVFPGQ